MCVCVFVFEIREIREYSYNILEIFSDTMFSLYNIVTKTKSDIYTRELESYTTYF